MRSRKNSGVLLDYYYEVIERTILQYQNPVTGLLPATPETNHSWVRDNVYSIMSVWGLSLAYKKIADLDDERARTYELEQSCVKLMRGLLMCMMLQKNKVERFKQTLSTADALHAKYNTTNCQTVVRDDEWGHLQIDATSLYLLLLAQMTASGLQIIFNLDEVAFIQNLIFYIEAAYYIPDYGIWERGDKTNHGLPELNASSIGMAKAALEAMNDLDLFGARGGPASVIHVLADEAHKCQAVLQSMLPRESNSKELDAALLSVISFPAFAVTDIDLINSTRSAIIARLKGRYGCKRFLRDGYKTAKEDPRRLYYEPWELRVFDKIECEWPLFFCYLIIDACFQNDTEMLKEYRDALDDILIKTDDGLYLVPELYSVPAEKVEEEYKNPHSQDRTPLGKCPFMWAQSLYILGRLLEDKFIAPGELDPLNRRLGSEVKPDVVVQVVVLAQDEGIRDLLRIHDLKVQTVNDLNTVEVQPARVLSSIYTFLGQNKKMNLSGRRSKDVGILSSSKIYALQDRIFAFMPQFADSQRFYIPSDIDLLIDICKTEFGFLKSNWHIMGRPTVIIPITTALLDDGRLPGSMISTMKKIKSGYINGTRVNLGKLEDFLSTSCITSLDFLNSHEEGYSDSLNPQLHTYLEKELKKSSHQLTHRVTALQSIRRTSKVSRRSSVAGLIKKSRSFRLDQDSSSAVTIIPPIYEERSRLTIRGTLSSFNQIPESVSDSESRTRSPSPLPFNEPSDDDFTPLFASRSSSDSQFDNIDIEELISNFREMDNIEEQGDVLHYFAVTKGLDWTVYTENDEPIKVKDLMKDLYEKACDERAWALVRHTAGMLGKRVEDLAKAVTDLLVRQKQVTVGMPPYNEKTISHPLPSSELRLMIHHVYGNDESTAMLTQELILYLAMFIRTEPQLFTEMLRLRVGLIIQVMASELARIIKCPGTEASEYLLNLSPFEMKNLLHHIISGKEFGVHSARSGTLSVITNKSSRARKSRAGFNEVFGKESVVEDLGESDRQGQWLRRRRLDGALNRVPKNFYPKIWLLLERCHGITIAGKVVPRSLTEEMTPGELKFALQVETVLNSIPQPEYRQLVVEALMILYLVVEYDAVQFLGDIIEVESLVHKANQIFLDDQANIEGDATLCCAGRSKSEPCGGTVGICVHFYDSAPSGSFGTMTYLIRAVANTLETLPAGGEIDCKVN